LQIGARQAEPDSFGPSQEREAGERVKDQNEKGKKKEKSEIKGKRGGAYGGRMGKSSVVVLVLGCVTRVQRFGDC